MNIKSFSEQIKKEYSIKLKFNISLKNCSYMFYNCFNIIDINFSHFNTENITNIECMFHSCHLNNFQIFLIGIQKMLRI